MESSTPVQNAEMLRVNDIVKRVGVSKGKVLGWIRRGELVASNVSDTERPEYRINEEEFAKFLARRTVVKVEPVRSRRKTMPLIAPEFRYE